MTDATEFTIADRSIKGDIQARDKKTVPQKTAAEFLAAIDTLLAVDGVKKIKWLQYTPYFNDGEPCEFSVHGVYVKLAKRFGFSDDDGDYEDGFVDDYSLYERSGDQNQSGRPVYEGSDETYDEWRARYDEWDKKNKTFTVNGQDTSAISDALAELSRQMPAFESVVQTNFGDHAEVTASTKGFKVEFHEHD